MNLVEIKKIRNITKLDAARVILNDCINIEQVVNTINYHSRSRFATTLVAVYCFDAISSEDEEAVDYIKTRLDCEQSVDTHFDALVENGAKILSASNYHTVVSKVFTLINRGRKEKN